jgi:hypothetical protein
VESKVYSALRPPNGLFCQPRVIMMMEKSVEWLAGETEVLGENCPSAALSTTNPTCCPDANPGRRGGKPATNRLFYGTAWHTKIFNIWCVGMLMINPFMHFYMPVCSYMALHCLSAPDPGRKGMFALPRCCYCSLFYSNIPPKRKLHRKYITIHHFRN